jgi:peptidoglycan/xylan/chitin deacetylase (PgdA/CDA1 family)
MNVLSQMPARWSKTSPLITFSFDDFPRSAYTAGAALLREWNVRATYYVSMGFMNSVGYFTESDLHEAIREGHELACHTFSHLDATSVSPLEFLVDIARNRDAMRKILCGFEVIDFAYPYGRVTCELGHDIKSRFWSARGTEPGLNRAPIERGHLRANRLYDRLGNLTAIEELIDRNCDEGGWLIFYTHDISNHPSEWGCTPHYFERVLRAAVKCGAKIMPVRDVLLAFGFRSRAE